MRFGGANVASFNEATQMYFTVKKQPKEDHSKLLAERIGRLPLSKLGWAHAAKLLGSATLPGSGLVLSHAFWILGAVVVRRFREREQTKALT